ncbi:MAG: hypothetical protein E6J02_00750 [Chloroflexi bacterium]|nr:MAG: hypothetical protein E6J02_00750 [Chloroflexota bacterium]
MRRVQVQVVTCALLLLVFSASPGQAASPSSGSVGPASGSAIAVDFAPVGPGVSSGGTIESHCAPVYCDGFNLTVALPQPDGQFYSSHVASLQIVYTWNSTLQNDMDVFAFAPDGTESGPGTPDDISTGAGKEVLTVANPASGSWFVESHVGITPVATPAHAVITLTYQTVTVPPPPALGPHDPRFTNASPPLHYQNADVLSRTNAGEPSLGTDWKRGVAMYMAGTQISRITFNDTASPPTATWTDVTPPQQGVVNEDAILFTDHQTNRTIATGLLVAGSNATYSDDAGATWKPGSFPVPHSPDHETVASGPYAAPAPPTAGLAGYPNAVWYCSQNILQIAGSFCGRSDDGGITYNPSGMVFGAGSPCGSISGHIKIAPDGTIYVPQNNCKRADGIGGQGTAMSTDNGLTWTYPVIPDSTARSGNTGTDPSIGVGSGGTIYEGYEAGDGHARIAVSHDRGKTWAPSVDVGAVWNVQNSKFPEVVAGDDNRAAYAFLGTSSAGNDQSASFGGTWYLYVAFTYDGGGHWLTLNATPGDPVQRGCIWNGGGSNPCRNLLDFNDIGIDQNGRVLAAYTDGCANIDFSYHSVVGGVQGAQHGPSNCDTDPNAFANTDKVSLDWLARQGCGLGLLAAKDPGFYNACPAPTVVSVYPAAGATGVPRTTGVSATFDQPVSSATLRLVDASGNSVLGTVACGNPCTRVIFTPSRKLSNHTLYTATATGTNPAGTATKTWSFST